MTTTDMAMTDTPSPLTLEERQEILSHAVAAHAAKGWTVLSQTPTQASLTKGKNTSHGVHIFLSIITLGVWLIVWLLLVLFAGKKTKLLTVDEHGNVRSS